LLAAWKQLLTCDASLLQTALSIPFQQLVDGLQKLRNVDGLGEVSSSTRSLEALDLNRHSISDDDEDWNGSRGRISLQTV
jgi:hypothetical protein